MAIFTSLRAQTITRWFEFLDWADGNHLRHTRFIGLRDDKKAKDVRREI